MGKTAVRVIAEKEETAVSLSSVGKERDYSISLRIPLSSIILINFFQEKPFSSSISEINFSLISR
jgi:hypothetical protein